MRRIERAESFIAATQASIVHGGKRAIITAASHAQRAADFLHGAQRGAAEEEGEATTSAEAA